MVEQLTLKERQSLRSFTGGRLRVWLILALIVLSAAAVADSHSRSGLISPAQQIAPARAQVVLDTTQHDYGEVFAGEELDYPYNILNAGTAPLELMHRQLTSRAAASSAVPLAINALERSGPRYQVVRVAAKRAAPS